MGPINSFADLISALWRKAWVIALVCVVGLPLALLFALSQPRLYEATAVIQIEAPEVTVTTAGQVQGMTADGQLDLITQNLMARDNIVGMIDRFGLFPEVASQTERVALLRESVSIVKLIDPAQAWRPDVQPAGLSITVRLGEAQAAAAVANDFLAQIIAEARSRSESRATRTLEFLIAEETRVAAEIASVEGRIAAFREANVDSLPEGLTAQRDRLTRLNETRLALDREIVELEGARDRLRAEDVAQQLNLLTGQRALVAADIATIELAIASAPEVERELSALARDLSQLESELTVLTTRRTEAAMTQLIETQEQSGRFEVLETAIPPEFPVSASRRKIAMAGGVAVVMAAFTLAIALELLHPAIRTSAQMERLLGVQPVIVVPRLRNTAVRRRRRWLGLGLIAVLVAGVWALVRGGAAAIAGLFGARDAAPVAVTVAGRRRQ